MDLACGCSMTPACCICNGTWSGCFPWHFARGKWRVYGHSFYRSAACKDRSHRQVAHSQNVLVLKPTVEERKMLYRLARTMKPKDKKLLRQRIRETRLSDMPDVLPTHRYMELMGRPDLDEGQRARDREDYSK